MLLYVPRERKQKKMAIIPTPHNEAMLGDFADTVLMPGDPLRSKFIAENFLEDAKLVNNVRGIQGYTGTYNGKKVSVMASGMGQPSIGIYSFELFNFYDVKNIIRIGTTGAYDEDLHLGDMVIAQAACTDGNYIKTFCPQGTYAPIADYELMVNAVKNCKSKGFNYKVGNLLTSDIFYEPYPDPEKWKALGVLAVDMEAAALYTNAAFLKKRALTICTVSNSFVYEGEDMTAKERQTTLGKMIEVALETAIDAYEF